MGLGSKSNKPPLNTGKPFCEQYAYHGFCQDGNQCSRSHDLDVVLDHELDPRPKKQKQERESEQKNDKSHVSKPSEFTQTHSAAFDAFMTGYIFAHQQITEENILHHGRNRIYLIGKQLPLMVEKSRYTNVSKPHQIKRKQL
jgi:target of EGR1 protein 1